MNLIKRFLQSEDGPTATEYAVMLALIIIVALTAISTLGEKVQSIFTNVEGSLPDGSAAGLISMRSGVTPVVCESERGARSGGRVPLLRIGQMTGASATVKGGGRRELDRPRL